MFLEMTISNKYNSNKEALVCNNVRLSFRELNMCAMKMSKCISSLTNGGKVIILLNKSVEAIIAIYGALYSKCTFIPVDYNIPAIRLNYIIKNSESDLPLDYPIKRICIDHYNLPSESDNCDINWDGKYIEYGDEEFCCSTEGRDPFKEIAYIIFTSGSTGAPKGIMIPHSSIMNFVKLIKNEMHYDETTVYLNTSPLYFDASVLDIFCILNTNGKFVLQNKTMFTNNILSSIEKERVTDTLLVPSLIKMIISKVARIERYDLSSLKTIWYGGEGCPVNVIKEVKERIPQISFIHGYGPTETTHTALWYKFEEVPDDLTGYMPIGVPLNDLYVYVFDEDMHQVACREKGELYIGGDQLMSGYCNDAETTKKYLVDDPYYKDRKLYKTGDIVYKDESGIFWYCGRNDDMVKCGGNLVYKSEIEKTILTYPLVEDAVVLSCEDELYNNKLVAIVIVKDDSVNISSLEIRNHIQSRLPAYMIPSQIYFFNENEVPKNSNGKIDRNSLKQKLISV